MRNQFDYTFLAGERRIGLLIEKAEGREAVGTRGQLIGRGIIGSSPEKPPINGTATIAEKVGNRTYGWRMETLAPLSPEALASFIQEYHQKDKEASLTCSRCA